MKVSLCVGTLIISALASGCGSGSAGPRATPKPSSTRVLSLTAAAKPMTPARPASKYVHTLILPPRAVYIYTNTLPGNPINSQGVLVVDGAGSPYCGDSRSFVYFPKTRRYVALGKPPGLGKVDMSALGIADDKSIAVEAWSCPASRHGFEKARILIYRATLAGTTAHWSKPCPCRGYDTIGINSDGIGLNGTKRGAAVLSYRNGTPKITPLTTSVGKPAKAHMIAVGTPRGFVGTQHDPATGRDVPTVWLNAKPYVLPVAGRSSGPVTPAGMAEHWTRRGLQADVVGTLYDGADSEGGSVDYWTGVPASSGLEFAEHRGFAPRSERADGMSTDGSRIFGDDSNGDNYWIYSTISHSYIGTESNPHLDGCGVGWSDPAGDSHGDILVSDEPIPSKTNYHYYPCLAQPER